MMTDRSLKRLNNGEIMAPMASDMVCPYSQSGQNGGKNATFMPTSRCATLGRVKNLEMTEYQRQKYVNGAAGSNIVSIRGFSSDLDNIPIRTVFCYQNCSDLLCEKIALEFSKNLRSLE